MALTIHHPCGRRLYGVLGLTVVCLILWYSHSQLVPSSPGWEVVDFRITEDLPDKNTYQLHPPLTDVNEASPSHPPSDPYQQHRWSSEELQVRIKNFIRWERPSTDHWPAWSDYEKLDYDPNRWEGMDRQVQTPSHSDLLLTMCQ